jgi:hypothetical protein
VVDGLAGIAQRFELLRRMLPDVGESVSQNRRYRSRSRERAAKGIADMAKPL